jgi:glutathione peroxidase
MALLDLPVTTIDGRDTTLADYTGQTLLIVNVASKCGFTRQYAGLEALHERYAERGFAVLGFPCNQFGGQEPGTETEIQAFCSATYGVTFPMFAKVEVNGADRHPLYAALTQTADAEGAAGDIQWNFEKFLVSRDGTTVTRYRSAVEPEDTGLVESIEKDLAN